MPAQLVALATNPQQAFLSEDRKNPTYHSGEYNGIHVTFSLGEGEHEQYPYLLEDSHAILFLFYNPLPVHQLLGLDRSFIKDTILSNIKRYGLSWLRIYLTEPFLAIRICKKHSLIEFVTTYQASSSACFFTHEEYGLLIYGALECIGASILTSSSFQQKAFRNSQAIQDHKPKNSLFPKLLLSDTYYSYNTVNKTLSTKAVGQLLTVPQPGHYMTPATIRDLILTTIHRNIYPLVNTDKHIYIVAFEDSLDLQLVIEVFLATNAKVSVLFLDYESTSKTFYIKDLSYCKTIASAAFSDLFAHNDYSAEPPITSPFTFQTAIHNFISNHLPNRSLIISMFNAQEYLSARSNITNSFNSMAPSITCYQDASMSRMRQVPTAMLSTEKIFFYYDFPEINSLSKHISALSPVIRFCLPIFLQTILSRPTRQLMRLLRSINSSRCFLNKSPRLFLSA